MGKHALWIWPAVLLSGCSGLAPHQPQTECASPAQGVILVHYPEENQQAKPVSQPEPDQTLQMAAACLERGDDADALRHLARYIEAHPEHVTIRAHYAELLLRQKRRDEARRQFERYVADAQLQGEPATKHLVHVETRLVEIAQANDATYDEHLHRGIGLLLLARQVAARPDSEGPDPEKMLFKAASELQEASKEQPDAARPYWYAYEVWSQLGQQLPAQKNLRRALAAGPVSDLTAAEKNELNLARESERFFR
jgi:tetratricopeptide (TPR) repeat protein